MLARGNPVPKFMPESFAIATDAEVEEITGGKSGYDALPMFLDDGKKQKFMESSFYHI